MIFKLFARKSKTAAVERLYAQIMAAARRPELFLGRYRVPDSLEGRFDLLTLHVFAVVRRLQAMPAPAPELAQALSDWVFLSLDRALREMGVGDLAVPKRMKKLAADYNGRCSAYEEALAQGGDALQRALGRNVYGSPQPAEAEALARYMLAVVAALKEAPLAAFQRGEAPFPDPATIV